MLSLMLPAKTITLFFFFNDTATTEIYTLSLHDALPISQPRSRGGCGLSQKHLSSGSGNRAVCGLGARLLGGQVQDRKSTRLNSSHLVISYAVFCLKKKTTSRPRTGTASTWSLGRRALLH